jgi:glyoxylase-like metal-dependent hydrolase (beta-lactamase superfamily II)
MRHTKWLAAGTLVLLTSCARTTPAQQIVNDAAASLGGAERLQAVRTLTLEGDGLHYYLGQDVVPGASGQTFAVSGYKRVIDLPGGRMRSELTRTPNFLYFQGQMPQRQVQGVDGEVGYNVNARGNATRVPNPAAQERRTELHHHPLTIVRAALAPGASVSNARTEGAERVVDIKATNGLQFVLAVDSSGLPIRVESLSDHPNLGDVTLSTLFADYQKVDGLMLPSRVTTKVDAFTTSDIRLTSQAVDGDVGDLAAPADAASAAAIAAPPPPAIVTEDVAPGVWRLAGQSHHSVVVEFLDHLMLIEAPQSEARTLAVIAKARELRPDKPLTTLLSTHHHFDHTAGIRAAVSEGLTIVTHSGNKSFVEDVVGRPHTIAPDALVRKPNAMKLQTVDDEHTIEDKAMKVVIYHIPEHPHSETMLMAYFPRERLLVEVDTFVPSSERPLNPYIAASAAKMVEQIKARNLRVERIVPLHFSIEPLDALVKLAATRTN